MPRVNVLHIYKFYLPHAGGIERTIQLIAEGLKDNGIEFKILVCTHNRSMKSTEGVIGTIGVTRANSLGILFSTPLSINFFSIFQRLAREADILHLHSPFPLGEIGYLLLKPRNKKLVVTYHADISQTKWACFAPFYKHALKRLLEKADCIILTSPAMVESSPLLHKFLNKCKVIPLGIDLKKWDLVSKEKKKELKDRLEIGNGKVVLFVGRLTYYKGLDYLIDAMQKVNSKLIIIGSGELKEHLKEESTKLGVKNKIHFVGQVPEDELPIYYSIADVFVLPSINGGEAFGLVQLEAMAFGIPVVNTNLPTGVTFVSPHNETGLTVPPRNSIALANAINTILEDDALRLHFSENARLRVKLFSLERMLSETYKVYVNVMEQTL
jgi:glycosyltransferase involved in cell wall biosynthesis